MARRLIGQELLAVGCTDPRGGTSLDEVAALVDWTELDRLLAGISSSTKGELGWPPLALFRALLLATWHDLSDVRLAEALDDRASFRRFCGFAAHELTPERTAFVRFRAELVRLGLDRALFETVTRQFDARGIVVRTGTLVDATLISSASIQGDAEARWAGTAAASRCIATRRTSRPIRTPASSAASRSRRPTSMMRPNSKPSCPIRPATCMATARSRAAGQRQSSWPAAVLRALCTRALGAARRAGSLAGPQRRVRRVRCRIEKVFGTAKRCYGLRRMRWLGLAKAGLQVRLTAIAYNLRRSSRLLASVSA